MWYKQSHIYSMIDDYIMTLRCQIYPTMHVGYVSGLTLFWSTALDECSNSEIKYWILIPKSVYRNTMVSEHVHNVPDKIWIIPILLDWLTRWIYEQIYNDFYYFTSDHVLSHTDSKILVCQIRTMLAII